MAAKFAPGIEIQIANRAVGFEFAVVVKQRFVKRQRNYRPHKLVVLGDEAVG